MPILKENYKIKTTRRGNKRKLRDYEKEIVAGQEDRKPRKIKKPAKKLLEPTDFPP